MVGKLPIPNPFPNGKGLLLCDELACLREGWLVRDATQSLPQFVKVHWRGLRD